MPLKSNFDAALLDCKASMKCPVFKRTSGRITWIDGRDYDYNEMAPEADDYCAPAEMNAEDALVHPLYHRFGQPKSIVHTAGGSAILRPDTSVV